MWPPRRAIDVIGEALNTLVVLPPWRASSYVAIARFANMAVLAVGVMIALCGVHRLIAVCMRRDWLWFGEVQPLGLLPSLLPPTVLGMAVEAWAMVSPLLAEALGLLGYAIVVNPSMPTAYLGSYVHPAYPPLTAFPKASKLTAAEIVTLIVAGAVAVAFCAELVGSVVVDRAAAEVREVAGGWDTAGERGRAAAVAAPLRGPVRDLAAAIYLSTRFGNGRGQC